MQAVSQTDTLEEEDLPVQPFQRKSYEHDQQKTEKNDDKFMHKR